MPGFNIQFKIILGQFNSIKYSIQNYSWSIQFNEISNQSLEFQEVLHDQNRLDLCLPVPKGIFVDRVGGQPNCSLIGSTLVNPSPLGDLFVVLGPLFIMQTPERKNSCYFLTAVLYSFKNLDSFNVKTQISIQRLIHPIVFRQKNQLKKYSKLSFPKIFNSKIIQKNFL